ncbi:MAG TPA: MFS transporter [Syntrophales bacterium]|nr:MFS transporter [Syntrophales bacterium]
MKHPARDAWGWAFYDFANSAFATTVMAGFFPVFFKIYGSQGVDAVVSTARLGFANALTGIFLAVLAPWLGAMADRGGNRKGFLAAFASLGILATASLYLVPPGLWMAAAVFYVMAVLGFSGGNIFYDALLPAVASEDRYDSVSSFGFSLGYLGGGLLFAVNLWMVFSPGTFGLSDAGQAVRFSFLTVGAWWLIFSLPLFRFVREAGGPVPASFRESLATAGFRQVRRTLKNLNRHRTVLLFLLAYWCYMDGVDTVIRMAVDYGLSIGLEAKDLLLALLMTQFVSFPAVLAFGFLAGRGGTKRVLLFGIGVYFCLSVWGAFIDSREEFFILAFIVGLIQGGVQALSRSFFGRLIPVDRPGEYYGFFNMVGKFSVILGPFLVALTGQVARALGAQGTLASRFGISAVALLFLAGGILLLFVDEKKGKAERTFPGF